MAQLETVYGEVFRVLKPGALFASYEWVSTARFDANNAEHVRIIDEINYGNGLPVLTPFSCTFPRAPYYLRLQPSPSLADSDVLLFEQF